MGELSLEQISAVSKRARCLHTEQQVEAALDAMAAAITERLHDSNPVLLCIMNGGLIVCGKLATRLNFPLQMDYLHATRYRDKTVGADLQWKSYPVTPLAGRVVLIVDDILDEGATLASIVEYCTKQGASEVLTAVLVEKQHARKLSDLQADFVGLEVEDFYFYGYGMDYKGYLRNAAGIFAVAEQDYES
ncbi:MAG: hypoxanthine-guanine phosphoribosyltransferase [Gammaproteobacteria bacterium]|mgnify:FL=1|jgi:hypoxanthine phosphoribosyltransferase|nr:hypoxanthine-guanine phosphoribosyltransferase [Gammaproteobacteria bacterium]HJN96546.1 hypoxanthine-guanine phosphoribosyltransferase [Gammaproteobacteria bacterium]|tara:strand:+ start:490 stop:1059 length:570 start_codon:yes stop_codon:yes gene_type:complete